METRPLEIGICSWSVSRDSYDPLLSALKALQLRVVHLAVEPAMGMKSRQVRKFLESLAKADARISATKVGFSGEDYSSLDTIAKTGGLVPDQFFAARFKTICDAAEISQRFGVKRLSTHVGFIPDRREGKTFTLMIDRMRKIADALADMNVELLMETGQENPEVLAEFLAKANRANLGVNFDPANIILYGRGDPVFGAEVLFPWIRHVHMKDARHIHPQSPEAWHGTETGLGRGDARLADVIRTLRSNDYRGELVIEREVHGLSDVHIREDIHFLGEVVDRLNQASM